MLRICLCAILPLRAIGILSPAHTESQQLRDPASAFANVGRQHAVHRQDRLVKDDSTWEVKLKHDWVSVEGAVSELIAYAVADGQARVEYCAADQHYVVDLERREQINRCSGAHHAVRPGKANKSFLDKLQCLLGNSDLLDRAFTQIDKDRSNVLEADELEKVNLDVDAPVRREQVNRLLGKLDRDGDHRVSSMELRSAMEEDIRHLRQSDTVRQRKAQPKDDVVRLNERKVRLVYNLPSNQSCSCTSSH